MQLILTLALCIIISFLFTRICKKLSIPATVGLILAGIAINSSYLKNIVLGQNAEFVLNLGDVGLVVLMFIAGMEVSWREICREKKEAATISVFVACIPFLVGFIVFLIIGFSLPVALTVGICMSITAEGTKAKELLELGKLKTRISSLMMGAGIIDDIVGMFLFVIICYWFTGSLIINGALLSLGAVLVFFCGIAAHKSVGRHTHRMHIIEKFLMFFVVPFFFISMGNHFSFQSLVLNPWLTVIILVIATFGKIGGVFFARKFVNLSLKQIYLIGWGMNSRGAVELAIAFIAYRVGLLNIQLYSGLIFMALVTTLIFPFVLRRMIKADKEIMN